MTGLTKNKTKSAKSKDEFQLPILYPQIHQTIWLNKGNKLMWPVGSSGLRGEEGFSHITRTWLFYLTNKLHQTFRAVSAQYQNTEYNPLNQEQRLSFTFSSSIKDIQRSVHCITGKASMYFVFIISIHLTFMLKEVCAYINSVFIHSHWNWNMSILV